VALAGQPSTQDWSLSSLTKCCVAQACIGWRFVSVGLYVLWLHKSTPHHCALMEPWCVTVHWYSDHRARSAVVPLMVLVSCVIQLVLEHKDSKMCSFHALRTVLEPWD
jgi:hypothetical protein